jgi:phosphohistidine phosphatase
MLLHLLRHAHAGDPYAWDGPDAIRPLTHKGRAQADRLGRLLAGQGFEPDLVVTSPRTRARETAEVMAELLGVSVTIDDRLAEVVDLAVLDAILTEHGDPERPVLVGHDPDFTDLVADLCGAVGVPMRKGSFVRIEVDRPLTAGTGLLRWLVPPDLLKPER